MSCNSSLAYCRSRPLGVPADPAAKQISETHCCPPHSNPSTLSDHSILSPCIIFQHSASAAFTCLMCSTLSGSILSSSSRSWGKDALISAVTPCVWSSVLIGRSRSSSGILLWAGAEDESQLPGEYQGLTGLLVTTTTDSVYGIHIYRMCLLLVTSSACCFSTSAIVETQVHSCSWCAGTHRRVTSATTPRAPRPTRAISNRCSLSSGSSFERVKVPRAGVTSL
mmetsp:Transcript_21832/g.32040  ORF Transcript_21832/g.32040 Transcript_21832/m.32040 type:complete len:224 (-) Transcript_21832:299-970(-)